MDEHDNEIAFARSFFGNTEVKESAAPEQASLYVPSENGSLEAPARTTEQTFAAAFFGRD